MDGSESPPYVVLIRGGAEVIDGMVRSVSKKGLSRRWEVHVSRILNRRLRRQDDLTDRIMTSHVNPEQLWHDVLESAGTRGARAPRP